MQPAPRVGGVGWGWGGEGRAENMRGDTTTGHTTFNCLGFFKVERKREENKKMKDI